MTWMVDNGKTQYLEASAQRLKNYYTKIGELPLAGNSEMLSQRQIRPNSNGGIVFALQAIPDRNAVQQCLQRRHCHRNPDMTV